MTAHTITLAHDPKTDSWTMQTDIVGNGGVNLGIDAGDEADATVQSVAHSLWAAMNGVGRPATLRGCWCCGLLTPEDWEAAPDV